MTSYLGIDPGFSGALAVVGEDHIKIFDPPTMTIGKKKDYDINEIVKILAPYCFETKAAIEKVHALPPPASRASAFTFGKGYGIWIGILTALGIPFEEVTPQSWQGVMMNGIARSKDSSRKIAMQLYPQFHDQLKNKNNHGRSDALLIATWKMRQG